MVDSQNPTSPNYTPGTGRLVTDRFDFQKHIDGYSFRHQAPQIDLFPTLVIGGNPQNNVQQALTTISSMLVPPTIPDATSSVKGIIKLGGDLSGIGGTAAAPKVSAIQGYPILNVAPSAGYVLYYNGSAWTPQSSASAFTNITISSGNTLEVQSGGTLLLDAGSTFTSSANTSMTIPSGSITFQNGTVAEMAFGSELDIATGANETVEGTITIESGGVFVLNSGSTFTANTPLNLASSGLPGSGAIRMPNGTAIVATNDSNTTDLNLIKSYSPAPGANQVIIGDVVNVPNLLLKSSTNTNLTTGSQTLSIPSTGGSTLTDSDSNVLNVGELVLTLNNAATTTSTSAVATNLTFSAATGEIWYFKVTGLATGSAGIKFAIGSSGSAAVLATIFTTGSFATSPTIETANISTINVLSSTVAAGGQFIIDGFIDMISSGSVTIQFASPTGASTHVLGGSTLFACRTTLV